MAGSLCTQQARFPLGQHVEVLQTSKALRGSWQLATITMVKNGRREIEYKKIFQSDGVHKLRESFSVMKDSEIENKCWLEKFGRRRGFLRPRAPKITSRDWTKGLLVDAFDKGAWWEGVILEDTGNANKNALVKVFFPDQKEESLIHSKWLRVSHQWDELTGEWEAKGCWKGISLSGGKESSYQEIVSVNLYTPHKHLVCHNQLIHIEDAEVGASRCQKEFKELIERKKKAARQFLLDIGYTMEFHQRIGRRREAVYISPNGRRFYSLTMACKAYKKELNMPLNLGACKSRVERLLCIYDIFTSSLCIESTPIESREIYPTLLSPGTSSSVVTEVNLQIEGKEIVDEICSVCGDGGDLVLCDYCPSTYHTECVGLEVIPEENWYCFGCCCASCEGFLFESDDCALPLTCKLCDTKYHVKCLPSEGRHGKEGFSKNNWFCGMSCEEVYIGLCKQLRISHALEMGGLSWMLLKSNEQEGCLSSGNKLSMAHVVLQECFNPMIDVCTGLDIISQTVFSKGSAITRLNCLGFYTLILERGCELISVATFRIHGSRLAEMPFIGTRFHYRRKGMCRRLMCVLEKMLLELGVRKLLLPAVPQLMKTWRQKFKFQHINSWDRMEMRRMNVMRFPETTILKKNVVRLSSESHGCLVLSTQGICPSGTSFECKADFRRGKRLRYETQTQNLDVEDTKVVIATTKYKRLVKSPQWYVESMKDLSNDAELLRKERRPRPWRKKQKKALVDAKIKRRQAKHAIIAFRPMLESSIPADADADQGTTVLDDSVSLMPATSDLSTFLLDTQDPPRYTRFYTRRKTRGKTSNLNSSGCHSTSRAN